MIYKAYDFQGILSRIYQILDYNSDRVIIGVDSARRGIFIIRTDSDNNVLWSRIYQYLGLSAFPAYGKIFNSRLYLLAIGLNENYNYDFLFLVINLDNAAVEGAFFYDGGLYDALDGHSVVETTDALYLFGASFDTSSFRYRPVVFILNSNSILSVKELSNIESSCAYCLSFLRENNNFLIMSNSATTEFSVQEIDQSLTTVKSIHFDFSGIGSAFYTKAAYNDSRLYMFLSDPADKRIFYFTKYDFENDQFLTLKKLVFAEELISNQNQFQIFVDSDGIYIVGFNQSFLDLNVYRFDHALNLLWKKRYHPNNSIQNYFPIQQEDLSSTLRVSLQNEIEVDGSLKYFASILEIEKDGNFNNCADWLDAVDFVSTDLDPSLIKTSINVENAQLIELTLNSFESSSTSLSYTLAYSESSCGLTECNPLEAIFHNPTEIKEISCSLNSAAKLIFLDSSDFMIVKNTCINNLSSNCLIQIQAVPQELKETESVLKVLSETSTAEINLKFIPDKIETKIPALCTKRQENSASELERKPDRAFIILKQVNRCR